MNNLVTNSQPSQISNSSPKSLMKLLVFEVGKLTLALPILQVKKVVRKNAVHGSGLSHVNLAHLEEQEVAVVDLHQKLFKVTQAEVSPNQGYFIVTKNIIGEPLGIFVVHPPSIIDVPSEQIRLIPDSFRRADTLEIASHVVVIPEENAKSLTIFMLDLERLL